MQAGNWHNLLSSLKNKLAIPNACSLIFSSSVTQNIFDNPAETSKLHSCGQNNLLLMDLETMVASLHEGIDLLIISHSFSTYSEKVSQTKANVGNKVLSTGLIM